MVNNEAKKKRIKLKYIIPIITTLITSATTIFFGHEAYMLKNITQQVSVSITNTLGENSAVNITSDTNLTESSDELITAYNNLIVENEELKNNYQNNQSENKVQIESLKLENQQLKNQVQNLKAMLLNTYTPEEINIVVESGVLNKAVTKRLDNIEFLDGVNCGQIPTVVDLYGTTHSTSYELHANGTAWGKFKLDGRYDMFSANIVTSTETSRDANIRVEFYVDDVLVAYVDNVVRDENVRPISFSVNGGDILMIKAVRTNSIYSSYCYITDTTLTVLE